MNKKGEPVPAVQLRDGEIARREGGRVAVRATPVRVRVELTELVAADGHVVNVTFSCSAVARPEAAERQMLEEALLSDRPAATAGDVANCFTPRLRDAGGRAAAGRAGADWLGDGGRTELMDVLRRAAEAAAFTTGLELLPPYQVDVESPSLRRAEQDRAARELAERAQAERLSHLRRAAEVLKEFNVIREASPGLSVSALVSRVAPEDQARVVQGLMDAGGAGAATVYAVAGPCLVRIGVDGAGAEEVAAPTDAGPFRSVQAVRLDGELCLALGARGGVVLVRPEAAAGGECYVAPDVVSAMGFNRVVVSNSRLWASHSEAGLVGWDLGAHDRPAVRVGRDRLGGGGGEGPRYLQVVGNRLLFAVGDRVCSVGEGLDVRCSTDGVPGDPVVALLPHARGPIVVRASGEVDVLDAGTLGVVRRDRRSSRVTAAALVPFYDSPRVLLATEDGPLTCLSVDDPAVMQYPSAHRGLRALAMSGGRVAGVSADRQRVVVMDTGPGRGIVEVHVAARFKHRVADVAFVD